jgi:hypothetical protein
MRLDSMNDSRFEVHYVGSDGLLYMGDCTLAKGLLTVKMGTISRTASASASGYVPEDLARDTLSRMVEEHIATKKRT